ncbi:hypothetical protein [Enterovibrio nigricans]|uniref:Uncharacterized protein n=1 Tax=Enterovibrio nigricans DSM 22720 TaxID=1121868 RepID=A0A1T4V576_9GAMM|nr:hypothetical protein [Enterovibrio nigricans]PKF48853.1 hypothetical protein AT251_23110 [Enterovibrio nigricans]SKA59701.1 hypothetical protein SAMN02745132_03173 [Enterovibrio nigricans DSM 22720]
MKHRANILESASAMTTIAGNGQFPIAVPHWIDVVNGVSASKGEKTIECTTSFRGFHVDGYALIYKSPSQFEVHKIDAIHENGITLNKGLSNNFNNALVAPASYCISKDGLETSRESLFKALSIKFTDINYGSYLQTDIRSFQWLETYLDLPVLINRIGQKGSNSQGFKFNIKEKTTASNHLDFSIAQDFGRTSCSVELVAIGIEKQHQLKQLLWHLKGRLNALWWVNPNSEIRLAYSCLRNRLLIEPLGLESFANGVHLRLEWKDHVEYRFARSLGKDALGNEILALNSEDDTPVSIDDLKAGHIIKRMRPTSDDTDMHFEKGMMTVKLNLTEIPYGSD